LSELGVDECQVVANAADAGLVGDGAVAGDDYIDVHREQSIARWSS